MHRQAITWIGGVFGSIIAGVVVAWVTGLWPSANRSPDGGSTNEVWREGTLAIPVAVGNRGRVADLDGGRLLALGTSVPASEADIVVRQAAHGIIVEPGLSRGDGVTFDARFVRVADAPAGRNKCAAAAISPSASNHLQLSSNLHVGSHVCMITTQRRLAEFKLVKFDEAGREVTVEYKVWKPQPASVWRRELVPDRQAVWRLVY